MPVIRRLSDSCLVVTTNHDAILIDPGFHTFDSGQVDLESIGDISRVLITHEHFDHVKPEFVGWLIDRRRDVTVHTNQAVVDLLAKNGIEASTDNPAGVTAEDVLHEKVPSGDTPPNRAFTIAGVLTHPGDSYQPSSTAPVLAMALLSPWGSASASVEFARRLQPRQVIPIHDRYLSQGGRAWIGGMVKDVLMGDGIELMQLDWGDSFTL
jgi:L-ascorbate metabolism protein UlaG (beta-lactamase superfamily)